MFKGYFKADEDSLAAAFFGATVGEAIGQKVAPKVKSRFRMGIGALAALAARAALDPELKAERGA